MSIKNYPYPKKGRGPERGLRTGKRSSTARCPRCKKLRRMWHRPNHWWGARVSSMNVTGEGKVCWVCRIREVDPTWRPGKPKPDVPNGSKLKPV